MKSALGRRRIRLRVWLQLWIRELADYFALDVITDAEKESDEADDRPGEVEEAIRCHPSVIGFPRRWK